MIKAVIFDVDGVLIDSFEANLKFYQDLFVKAGYNPPTRDEYQNLFFRTMMEVIELWAKPKSKEELMRIFTMGANREVRHPSELISTPPGAEQTVRLLSEKYKLAIVTGRIKQGIFIIPQLAKLEKYFQTVVAYEDTEKHKPDPEPLLLAAKNLGVDATEAVYIGDAEIDIQAAKAARMKAVFYSNENIKGPDAFTSSFVELPELIKGFN